jgi:hypothetical protein
LDIKHEELLSGMHVLPIMPYFVMDYLQQREKERGRREGKNERSGNVNCRNNVTDIASRFHAALMQPDVRTKNRHLLITYKMNGFL